MDTIEQAIANFEKLGFTNINHVPSQPDTEEGRETLEVEKGFSIREGDNVDQVYAKKELIFGNVNKMYVDGRFFLGRTPQYTLETNACYAPLVDLRYISFGNPIGQIPDYPKSKQRYKSVEDFVRARIKEVKPELGIDPDVKIFVGFVSVKMQPGFYLSGENLPEMWDKFNRALKEFF